MLPRPAVRSRAPPLVARPNRFRLRDQASAQARRLGRDRARQRPSGCRGPRPAHRRRDPEERETSSRADHAVAPALAACAGGDTSEALRPAGDRAVRAARGRRSLERARQHSGLASVGPHRVRCDLRIHTETRDAPTKSRTWDLSLRKRLLYPTELWERTEDDISVQLAALALAARRALNNGATLAPAGRRASQRRRGSRAR